ncbi:hypothetical protein [sulfur-oxidizing endosymbiont of Gigantopelta aegis]|uniref:hypothetical protein n=1 Tax=sulfur-oxidizing endosymbiont of Gigantopelta aegis TaxID=2794934 RepID=UPI001BE47837|nr:hypothetical protein [sulfur-oxidizing endosymbiont of Gigantopelta aegis]
MLSEDLEKTYNLVFERKIKDGCDVVVKKNLEQFFNNNPELVKQLFSKEKTVLKRNLSKEIAEKYKSAIEGTGALCRIAENTKTIPVKGVPTASIPKKIHDLETVTRFLLKVTNLNQKVMWFTLALSLLSLILWISFFLM